MFILGETLRRARELDAEIRDAALRCRQANAKLAELLFEMNEGRLFENLGFASISAYAESLHHISARRAREMIETARRLKELKKMRAAFQRGEIDWTKARTASRVATPSNEETWLDRVRNMTSRELERAAAEEMGEPMKIRRTLELTPEQWAAIEEALMLVRRESETAMSLEEAIAVACRRAVEGGELGGARHRVVIDVCAECKTARAVTTEGAAHVSAISKEELDQVLCDAEVVDAREGPAAPLRRTMRRETASFIDERDRRGCRVPGCKNRAWIGRHREGGWSIAGFDNASKIVLLCDAHHRARHLGVLRIEGSGESMRFLLADGSPIGSREIPSAPRAFN